MVAPFIWNGGVDLVRILYLGKHAAFNLIKKEFDIFFDRTPIDQLNKQKIIDGYDILVIEISSENIDIILKWVFKLHCEKKIPILAVLQSCSSADKLLLNQFGIEDYIEDHDIIRQLERKLNIIANKIKWKKI